MSKYLFGLLFIAMPIIGIAQTEQKTEKKEFSVLETVQYLDDKQCQIKMNDETSVDIINLMVKIYLTEKSKNPAMIFDALNVAFERGCNINAHDEFGMTPLITATLFNDAELVKFLLAHGADKNIRINNKDISIHNMTANDTLAWLLEKEAVENKINDHSAVQALLAK